MFRLHDRVRAKDVIVDAHRTIDKHAVGVIVDDTPVSYEINDQVADYAFSVFFTGAQYAILVTTDEIEYASPVRRYLTR